MPRLTLSAGIREFWGGPVVTLPANNSADTVQRLFNVPLGVRELLVIPSETARITLCPRILAAYLVTPTTTSRIGNLAQFLDPSEVTTIGTPLTTTTYLVLGCAQRVGGVWIDVGTVNAVASTPVLAVAEKPGVWTAVSVSSDGTTSGGATLAVNGHMVWTAPSATLWPALNVKQMGGRYDDINEQVPMHWLRLSASATLTAGTSLNLIGAAHRDEAVTDANGHSGFLAATTEYSIPLTDEVGGVILRTRDATAGTMTLTWIMR